MRNIRVPPFNHPVLHLILETIKPIGNALKKEKHVQVCV